MAKRYDTFRYQFKVGTRIFENGITTDLESRERELQRDHPKGHIKQVGRKTTREAARKWLAQKLPIKIKYPDPQPPPGTGSVSRARIRKAIQHVMKATA